MKVPAILVAVQARNGKRKDGTEAVFYNVDVAIPEVGSGQVSVRRETFEQLQRVPAGSQVELVLGVSTFRGRLEGRVVDVVPVKGA